ncbi:hypothetical protein FQA39_LY00177 [Lamprigera yunnana]|nr:hypothetical protein FQA39_LY00177 [Lamprigera yunnana]
MKTRDTNKIIIKVDTQEHQEITRSSTRSTVKVLQEVANKENLVGRTRNIKEAKLAGDSGNPDIKRKKSADKSVQTGEATVTAADLTTSEEPSSDYWRMLAETRGNALDDSLQENEKLKDEIHNLMEENKHCKEMLDESVHMVELLQIFRYNSSNGGRSNSDRFRFIDPRVLQHIPVPTSAPTNNIQQPPQFKSIVNTFERTGAASSSSTVLLPPPSCFSNRNFAGQFQNGAFTNSGERKNSETAPLFKSKQFVTQQATDKAKVSGIKFNNKGNDNIRLFTGTAEKIVKWHKIHKDYFCFYEVMSSFVSIQEGTIRQQTIFILRDKKGPILQVVHYANDHIYLPNFCVGQMLRCVGHMVGPNIMHGVSIREAKMEEIASLQRMCYISDHAISKSKRNFQ